MRLSSNYSRVALFETQPDEAKFLGSKGGMYANFRVGPLLYVFNVDPVNKNGAFSVGFWLKDILAGSDEELVKIMSAIEKKPVSVEEAKANKQMISMMHDDILGLPAGYGQKVLGSAMDLVQKFVGQHNPRCLIFKSEAANRTSLYARMIKRFFSSANVRQKTVGETTKFQVCFR